MDEPLVGSIERGGEEEKEKLTPVDLASRVFAVDVLRGVAVLGILLMNIYAFAYPEVGYVNPLAIGGATGMNLWTWILTRIFVDTKFVTLFSMLFGAGLVLMADRREARGPGFRWVYFRRIGWLAVIGTLHAYLLWWGDILFTYAVCGVAIFFFRQRSVRYLLVAGSVSLCIGAALSSATGLLYAHMREAAAVAAAGGPGGPGGPEGTTAAAAGSGDDQRLAEGWGEVTALFAPTPAQLAEQIEIYRDGYVGIFRDRIPFVLNNQLIASPLLLIWRTGGAMLLGMGLLRAGVMTASRDGAFYGRIIALGYGVGLPLVVFSTWLRFANGFDLVAKFASDTPTNIIGSVFVALGHLGVVMTLVRRRALVWLQRRLAAVGRMALTNYLVHSVIGTTAFYGYGLGLFARVDRFALMGFVLVIWILQLAYSPWWLSRFRFGPAEWVWRSLTYRARQPMRVTSRGAAA